MLDPDRFHRIDALFDGALALPEDGRLAYLDRACPDDAVLRAEVIALLETVDAAESALGENVAEFAAPLISDMATAVDADPPLADGAVLGAWRIVRELGRGGMGAVYLAERADGAFSLRAALKVVKRGMDTAEVMRRFRAERRILAALDHPHIARVLDGGATPDGRPYLVMEYVEGQPIDLWCDAQRLDLRRRVALFRDVCDAVHHAHQGLVVHRDVKPSNVLVSAGGQPKLLDFGIAKLLDADDDVTVTSARLLTPDYAAPEQVTGQPVTTATDVYALGRLLHLLLAGARPARSNPRVASGATDDPSIPPSAAFARAAEAGAIDDVSVASARNTTPDRLRAALRGDLDTIVARAIAPEPGRRYGSALQLGEDLDRWLRRMPILARRDVLSYRLARFVRRNRAAVAAGALSVVLLLVFAVAMAAAQRRTADALVLAEDERDTAEEVAALLEGLFSAGDPTAARRERLDTLRVAALLDRGSARVRAELAHRPAVQARLLRALGDAYRGMGLFDAADPLLRDAVAGQRTQSDDAALAEALNSLGLLELERGRSADAEPWLREAAALRRTLPEADPHGLAMTLSNLAATHQDRADFEGAARLYEEAERAILSAAAPDTQVLGTVLNGRAMLAQRTGDMATVAELGERVLAIDRARLGPTHPRVGIDLMNVGFANERLGRLVEADSLFVQGLDVIRRALGEDHPMYFNGLGALANVRSKRGMRAEARPLFEAAIAGTRRTVGAAPDLSITLSQYATLLEADSAFADAEAAIAEAIDVARNASGQDHPSVGITTAQLADLRCMQGAFADAAAKYREAVDVLEAAFAPTHPRVLDTRVGFAACLTRAGQYADAEALLLASFETTGGSEAATAAGSPATRIAGGLAALYDAWGRPAEAATYQSLADTSTAR